MRKARRNAMSALGISQLEEIERLIDDAGTCVEARVVCRVEAGERSFPVHAIALGNPARDVPAVGFFGGVHGLERIGTDVLIAYLRSLVTRLAWDDVLQRQLETLRLVFMPLVNPGGVWRGTRANPHGVDLMRNAPVDSHENVPWLIGGQRLSARLPWYRGPAGAAMQAESQALCAVVADELLGREFSIALDCHSGYGVVDRLWFPYAHTVRPIAHLPELLALKELFDRSNHHHPYLFEPQSRQYLTHCDLWDHLYRCAAATPRRCFLPLTLEMGSWLWIKKNPRQLFTRQGIFNPLVDHRWQRVLRRHLAWFDFLTRAASSHARWRPTGDERAAQQQRALALWYGRRS
jgi:hypothetical protein